ncbi:hypothetical protein NMY22_g20158 [Coprinellus aureogranulatus]|nr:hypothetical protein NMY22_g20158 [Coprinellus aureogranulatus]
MAPFLTDMPSEHHRAEGDVGATAGDDSWDRYGLHTHTFYPLTDSNFYLHHRLSDATLIARRRLPVQDLRPRPTPPPDATAPNQLPVITVGSSETSSDTAEDVVKRFMKTRPTVILLVINRDEARKIMNADVEIRDTTPFLESWTLGDNKALVAYANSTDDWNTIAATSKIDLLPEQRRFPLIFRASLEGGHIIGLGRVTMVVTKIVLLIVAFVIGGAFAIWVWAGVEPFYMFANSLKRQLGGLTVAGLKKLQLALDFPLVFLEEISDK